MSLVDYLVIDFNLVVLFFVLKRLFKLFGYILLFVCNWFLIKCFLNEGVNERLYFIEKIICCGGICKYESLKFFMMLFFVNV